MSLLSEQLRQVTRSSSTCEDKEQVNGATEEGLEQGIRSDLTQSSPEANSVFDEPRNHTPPEMLTEVPETDDIQEYRTLLQSPHRRSLSNKPTRGIKDASKWDRTRTDTPESITICWRFEHDDSPQEAEFYYGRLTHSVQVYYNGFPQIKQGTTWKPSDSKQLPSVAEFAVVGHGGDANKIVCHVKSNGGEGNEIDFHLFLVDVEFEHLRGLTTRRLSAQFPNSPLVDAPDFSSDDENDSTLSASAKIRNKQQGHRARPSMEIIRPLDSNKQKEGSDKERLPNLADSPPEGFLQL